MPYNRAACGDSEDDEHSETLASLERRSPPQSPPRHLPQPAAAPRLAELDMRKVMLAAGGPNYESVLRDTDSHMGPDSEAIPASDVEQKSGEPRRSQASLNSKMIYERKPSSQVLYVLPITHILGKLPLVPVGDTGTFPHRMCGESAEYPGASCDLEPGKGDGCNLRADGGMLTRGP